MNVPHLSDDQLIESCFPVDLPSYDHAHLRSCAVCEARRATLARTIDDVGDILELEADAAFSADRLSRQRARVMQRIEQDGRPARVIAFPGHAHESHPAPTFRHRRWASVAAAVAASFVVGILAEHLAHDVPGRRQSVPGTLVARQAAPIATPIRAVTSDDELLGQVELAAGRVGPAALMPLDALTPRAWDGR